MNLFSQYIKAVKKSGLALIGVFLLYTFFDQSFTLLMEADLRSPNGASSFVFVYGAAYLINSIFFTTLSVLIIIFGLTETTETLSEYIYRYLNQSCIEVLRSWGKTLIWSFLLIIPGIIKYLQFLFVPFVVTTLPKYEEGKVDALAASRIFFKKHWAKALGAVIGFQVIWSYLSLDLFDEYRLFSQTPLPAFLISLLEAAVFLLYILVLFRIYSASVREVRYESNV